MRRRVMIMMAALGSCGGSSDPTIDAPQPVDAPKLIDAGCAPGCDPLVPTACSASQRCSWIVNAAQPRGGDSSCLPGGAVAVGLACMRDTNGGDNCAKGSTCYMNVCRQICDLAASASSCGTALTCRPTAFFAPCMGTTPYAGLCVP